MIQEFRLTRVFSGNVQGKKPNISLYERMPPQVNQHNETLNAGRENTMYGLEREDALGRSYDKPRPQGFHEEDLNDEVDADVQARRIEEPLNSKRS